MSAGVLEVLSILTLAALATFVMMIWAAGRHSRRR